METRDAGALPREEKGVEDEPERCSIGGASAVTATAAAAVAGDVAADTSAAAAAAADGDGVCRCVAMSLLVCRKMARAAFDALVESASAMHAKYAACRAESSVGCSGTGSCCTASQRWLMTCEVHHRPQSGLIREEVDAGRGLANAHQACMMATDCR